MRAARQAWLLSALEAPRARHVATSVPLDTTTTTDYGPLPVVPKFHADPFPHGKFLSIGSRTPEHYLEVRRDLRARSRALEAHIAQLTAHTATLSAQAGQENDTAEAPSSSTAHSAVALDAYSPLPMAQTEELLALDAKARRLEAMQGFVMSDADVYAVFHLHVQCGSFDLAVHDWLLQRILADPRGPPFPLSICYDLVTLLERQCLPRLPDATTGGVLFLSRLESSVAALATLSQLSSQVVSSRQEASEADETSRFSSASLVSMLCGTSSSSSSQALSPSASPYVYLSRLTSGDAVEATRGATLTVSDVLFAQYTELVRTHLSTACARRASHTGAEAEGESKPMDWDSEQLHGALRHLITLAASEEEEAAAAAVPASVSWRQVWRALDEQRVHCLTDLLTLHDTTTATSASSSASSSSSMRQGQAVDAFTHASRLVEAVRGTLVQGTHPYPLHLLGTWLLPLWEACGALNMFMTDALPLLMRPHDRGNEDDDDDTHTDAVDAEQGNDGAAGTGDDVHGGNAHEEDNAEATWSQLALVIPDARTQETAIRRALMTFTPLHTSLTTATPTHKVVLPRMGRSADSSAVTVPVMAPLDTQLYGNTRDALVLGPLEALTEVLMLLAEATARLKEVQLLTALQVVFCSAFLSTSTSTSTARESSVPCLAVEAWCGVLLGEDPHEGTRDSGDAASSRRAAVKTILETFANDFLTVIAYAKQSFTTDQVLWGYYDRVAILASAGRAQASTTEAEAMVAAEAALALSLAHVDAQQRSADGVARVGSFLDVALNACLVPASRLLGNPNVRDEDVHAESPEKRGPLEWETAALYVASAACDVPALTQLLSQPNTLNTAVNDEAAKTRDAQSRARVRQSVEVRARWRSALTGVSDAAGRDDAVEAGLQKAIDARAEVPAAETSDLLWSRWMTMLTQSLSAVSTQSPPSEEALTLTINGIVEFLIYHYSTRMAQDVTRPIRTWANAFICVDTTDSPRHAGGRVEEGEGDVHGDDDDNENAADYHLQGEGTPDTATQTAQCGRLAVISVERCLAAHKELLTRVEAVLNTVEKLPDSCAWQPSALSSLAVLVSAALPGDTDCNNRDDEMAARGCALLGRLAQIATQGVRSPATNASFRSGNALSVILLCLARAGLWEDVLPLVRLATAETGAAATQETQWSSATTLDNVALAEILTRARAAGAASVCAHLRQLRETTFF